MTTSPRIHLLSVLVLVGAALGRAAEPASAAGPLSRDEFVAAVAGEFVAHFKLEGELQLELLRAWSAPARVAHEWTVEILEYPTVLASSMLTRCRVLADGQPAGEFTLTMRGALWRDAWTARQPVTANASFDPALLETRRVDFLRERDALPAQVGDRGFLFARSIQANRLLTWRDISRRPLVRKGDLVEVAAIDGLLEVTMKGLAMENGAEGDTVTIRNPDSKKDFAAQVVAANRVRIRF
jgi:flagella basal body P-ring formation protein FlgA